MFRMQKLRQELKRLQQITKSSIKCKRLRNKRKPASKEGSRFLNAKITNQLECNCYRSDFSNCIIAVIVANFK